MSARISPPTNLVRVPLRGYERLATMKDGESTKIVHALFVTGDAVSDMLLHLPASLLHTFNKHPRMRALQLKDKFATAEIQPPLTAEDVVAKKLLRVQHGKQGDDDWERFAEQECNIGFDRYSQLPYYLVVSVDEAAGHARLMLFSDHYMADGYSGMVILNDLLDCAAQLSTNGVASGMSPLPLRPSLYSLWLDPMPWTKVTIKPFLKLLGRMLFKSQCDNFRSLLPARADQRDWSIPPPLNSTRALFEQGEPANMISGLARCKLERVTFGGALVAAIAVAHAHVLSATDRLCLVVDMDYNMRKRVPNPPKETPVGFYVAITPLERLAKEGVDVSSTTFWDLARAAKHEIDETLDSPWRMPLESLFLDQYTTSRTTPEAFRDVKVPHCLQADVNVSNIGRYPFAKTHTFGSERDLRVESLHVYNTIPTLSPAGCVYVTSVDAFNYSLAHKYEDPLARKLFQAVVATCERLAAIGKGETLADVAARLS